MLQIEEAQAMLTAQVQKIEETERVSLAEAYGRVLAEDAAARRDQPPFPRSPLDGYAVKAADVASASKESPAVLQVIGKIYAGTAVCRHCRRGTGGPADDGRPDSGGGRYGDPAGGYAGGGGDGSDLCFLRTIPNYCFQGEDYKREPCCCRKAGG